MPIISCPLCFCDQKAISGRKYFSWFAFDRTVPCSGESGGRNVGSCHIAYEVGKLEQRSPGSSLRRGTTHFQGVPFHLEISSQMCSEVGPLGGFRACQVVGFSPSHCLRVSLSPAGALLLWVCVDRGLCLPISAECPHQELLP